MVRIPDIEEVIRKVQSADSSWLRTSALFGDRIIENFSAFLRRYKEGALVVFVILALARLVYQKIKLGSQDPWKMVVFNHLIYKMWWSDIEPLINNIDQAVLALKPIMSPRVPSGSEIPKLKQLCRKKLSYANEQT